MAAGSRDVSVTSGPQQLQEIRRKQRLVYVTISTNNHQVTWMIPGVRAPALRQVASKGDGVTRVRVCETTKDVASTVVVHNTDTGACPRSSSPALKKRALGVRGPLSGTTPPRHSSLPWPQRIFCVEACTTDVISV